MYDIYIKNYLNGSGTLVRTEQLLYSIPILDSTNAVNDPAIKLEMGKTGSFEFTMSPVHPYYNALLQMKTVMRVVYDGETLFRGRVLTIDTSPFTGERKVHLEGDLAFLMDSMQMKTKEEKRQAIGILAYLTQIITAHNMQMYEEYGDWGSDKMMHLGEVPGQYSVAIYDEQKVTVAETKKFGSSSYETSMNALEALLKEYGGYFRTRYVNGVCYLDWLDYCYNYTVNGQPIEFGENMIDINATSEVENLFTALIPTGSTEGEEIDIIGYRTDVHGDNNRILVPQIVGLFSDNELNKGYHAKADYQNAVNNYGIIYKTQNFPNAYSKAQLWSYAIDWIKNNYVGGITSFNLTALDMHHVDGTVAKYMVGDRITVIYPDMSQHTQGNTPTIQKTLTLTSVQYNLHNPEKNSYTIGIPNNVLNKTYGTKKANSSGSGGASGGIGGGSRYADDNKTQSDIDYAEFDEMAWRFILDDKRNGDQYTELCETVKDDEKRSNILKATHMVVYNALTGTHPDGESKNAGSVRTFLVNGFTGCLELMPGYGPDNEDPLGFGTMTQEELATANRYATTIVIDSVKQEIGVRGVFDLVKPTSRTPESMAKLQEDLTLISMGIKKDNNNGYVKAYPAEKLLQRNTKESASITGVNGAMNSILSKVGFDGTGDLSTIVENGVTAVSDFFNPSTVGVSGTTPENTVKVDGGGGGGGGSPGSVSVGSSGDLNGWKVTLNKPITYTATIEGQTQTFTVPPGSVGADDFHFTKTYDSLHAKILVTDQAIMDRATINQLNAVEAKIDKITGTTIIAESRVSAATAHFGSASADNGFTSPYFYYKVGDMGAVNIVSAIVSTYRFTESGNTIKLQGLKVNGSSYVDLASFNIAATAKYQTDVAAAERSGQATTPTNLERKSSGTLGTYVGDVSNDSGTYVTFMHGNYRFYIKIGESTPIDIESSDIHIGSIGHSSSASGYTASTIGNLMSQHSSGYVNFTVTIDGSSATRTYSIPCS